MGSRALRQLAARSRCASARVAIERHDAIAALRRAARTARCATALRQRCSDVERITARIALRQVRPRELAGLRATLQTLPQLAPRLPADGSLLLDDRCGDGARAAGCDRELARATIADEPAALRARRRRHRRRLRRRARRAARDQPTTATPSCSSSRRASARAPASPTCACSSTRCTASTSRSRRARLDKVPADYRRRQTLKNAERFITPELKAFEDKALSAQRARAGAREVRSTSSCSTRSQPHLEALSAAGALARVARRARARWPSARCTLDWCRPQFVKRAAASRSSAAAIRWSRRGCRNSGGSLHRQRLPPRRAAAACSSSPARTWAASSTYMRQVALIVPARVDRLVRAGGGVPARPDRRDPHPHRRRRRPGQRAVDLHGRDDRGGGRSCTPRPSTRWC